MSVAKALAGLLTVLLITGSVLAGGRQFLPSLQLQHPSSNVATQHTASVGASSTLLPHSEVHSSTQDGSGGSPTGAEAVIQDASRALPRQLLDSQASTSAPKLAYVLLGSGTRDDLLDSILKQLRDRLLPWTPGDVLFFHTGEYKSAEQRAALTAIIPNLQILRVPAEHWNLPDGMKESDAPSWKYAPCCKFPTHGIGYRHMCRWYANALFHHLHKLGYRWVFRLDEDSEVLTSVRQNMVDWMEVHGKHYGYRLWDEDDKEVIWSLPEVTQWYITAREIKPKWLLSSCRPGSPSGLNSWGGWNRRVIYNNMFMADIDWWLTPEVQAYLQVLEDSHGYYLYRWGDAPVHTMVVGLFLRRDQVHLFGFGYCHKGNCDVQRRYWAPALRDPPP